MRTADQPTARRLTRVECFDQQLKQTRVRRQQLEKQTAKSIRFHEAHKLSERRIGIRRTTEPGKQQWPQLAKNLPGARRNVKSRRPLAKLGKVSCRLLFVAKICEIGRTRILDWRRVAHHAPENGAHPLHLLAQARKQIGPSVKTKAPRQSLERFPIFRDGVGLLFGLDLETMFDPAQETIGGFELRPRLR